MRGNANVVIVSSTTTTTPDGDSTVTETETPWAGAAVAPRSSAERASNQTPAVLTGKSVYGPQVTLTPHDWLRIDGVLHEVEGEPGVWTSPYTGRRFGIEVAVKKVS